jgi:Conjugative transposon protein TcpC
MRMSNSNGTAWPSAYAAVHTAAGARGPLPSNQALLDEAERPDLQSRGSWSGAGGRWVLWPLRAVLWAALLVIVYRGVSAIFFDNTAAPGSDAGSAQAVGAAQFPATLAEAYALEFGQVYLNFSPATQTQREQELAAFVPPSLASANPDLGWNGSGTERLQSEQVAGITVQDSQHAVVSLLATVSGQLMELGVPVYATGNDVVVSGEPAWLPAPQPISVPTPVATSSDPVAQSELLNQLPAFFQAYANGTSAALNRFLAPGTTLTGLGGSVTFDSIASVEVPPGGATRNITVTVVWQVLGQDGVTSAKLTMAYRVSVIDFQSGKWYVKGISASTEAVGAQ